MVGDKIVCVMKKFDISFVILWFLALVLIFFLMSCRTQYVEVPVVHTEVVHKTDTFIKRDSVQVHDSIYIHAIGDTVWYERWHTKYVDRWNERVVYRDSIRSDSVAVPYPVPAELSAWQKVKVTYGGYAIGVVLLVAVGAVLWLRRKWPP